MKLKYLEKRNKEGRILQYEADELNFNLTKNIIKIFKKKSIYLELIKIFPEKYIQFYFEKYFFEIFYEISNQCTIHKYDEKIPKKNNLQKLYIDNYVPLEFLIFFLKENKINIANKKIVKDKSFFKKKFLFKLKKSVYKILNLFNQKINKKEKKNINSINIGLTYNEGHILKHRSDFNFLLGNKIKPENVKIFFKNNSDLNYKESVSVTKKKIKDLGFELIKYPSKIFLHQPKIFRELEQKTLKKNNDYIEKYFNDIIYLFLQQVKYWYNFFKEKNIKILFNPHEKSVELISQQIAMNLLGGGTIGRCRSLSTKSKGRFFNYYPNNVFFVWGKNSYQNMLQTHNMIDNYVISGFPYHYFNLKNDFKNYFKQIDLVKEKFQQNGSKFTILLIDTNHSINQSYDTQVIHTKVMEKFYNEIFQIVLNDKNLSLVIKTKKINFFKKLTGIKDNLKKCIKNGKCYLDVSKGSLSSNYQEIVDFVIAAQLDLSSAFFEIICFGKRGVIFDYPDLKNTDPEIKEYVEKKLIFSNLDEMIRKLKQNIYNLKFGNWSYIKDDIDPFRDYGGGNRIEEYIFILLENLKNNKSFTDSINNANKFFTDKYGKDKIPNKIDKFTDAI